MGSANLVKMMGQPMEMRDVYIEKTPNADSRSAKKLNYDLVALDTTRHILAVKSVMKAITDLLTENICVHDYTKVTDFDDFFKAFEDDMSGEKKFEESDWWALHLTERHHLNDHVPDDVNLLDVLEMLVDGVAAGKARTGEVYPIELPDETLRKALINTQNLLIRHVHVDGER